MKTTRPICFWLGISAALFGAIGNGMGQETGKDSYVDSGWTLLSDSVEMPAEVTREPGSEKSVGLTEIDQPGITQPNHLVAGEVRHENLGGDAYLEMWTVYENGERFFTRTLGEMGPMQKLTGTSDWRAIVLPFHGSAEKQPVRLELNLVLPGGGKVEFRNFRLYQANEMQGIGLAEAAREGSRYTAIAVGVVAIFLFAAMLLASKGKGRGFVLGAMITLAILGVVGLIWGTALASNGLPNRWLPLLVGGTFAMLAGGIGFPFFRKAYLERELRQISATDRMS